VKEREVVLAPEAIADLSELADWIAASSGIEVALGYIARVEAACQSLSYNAERGASRDDIRKGLRTIGFERRATIAFSVTATNVTILRVMYGGRDIERQLMPLSD
jgi:toxin ParE1/3/4